MEEKTFFATTFYDRKQKAFAGFIDREPMVAFSLPIGLYTERATKATIREILVKTDKMFRAKEFDEYTKDWDLVTIKIEIQD